MIFSSDEKELLLRLITTEMSRLSIQGEDKEKVDKVIYCQLPSFSWALWRDCR